MRIQFETEVLSTIVVDALQAGLGIGLRGDLIYAEAGYSDRAIPRVINGIHNLGAKVVFWAGNEVNESLIYVGNAPAGT